MTFCLALSGTPPRAVPCSCINCHLDEQGVVGSMSLPDVTRKSNRSCNKGQVEFVRNERYATVILKRMVPSSLPPCCYYSVVRS